MASKPQVASSSPALTPGRASPHRALAALALATSAIAFFFGTGLHPIWWLTWLAPLPVLIAAPRHSPWTARALAFVAFTLGALNM